MFTRRLLFLTGGILFAVVGMKADQTTPGTSELLRRVDVLDAMVASLQKRVDTLERQVGSQKVATVSSAVPASKAAWRSLSKGMSMLDVRRILGEPDAVQAGALTTWSYKGGGYVMFNYSDRVSGWSEP